MLTIVYRYLAAERVMSEQQLPAARTSMVNSMGFYSNNHILGTGICFTAPALYHYTRLTARQSHHPMGSPSIYSNTSLIRASLIRMPHSPNTF